MMRIVSSLNNGFVLSGNIVPINKCDVLECYRSAVRAASTIATQTVNNDDGIDCVVGTVVLLSVDGYHKVRNFFYGDGLASYVIKQFNGYFATHGFCCVNCLLKRGVFGITNLSHVRARSYCI